MSLFRKLGDSCRAPTAGWQRLQAELGGARQAAETGLQKTASGLGSGLDRAGREADRALEKAGREGGKALEGLDRAGREAGRALDRAGRETGRALDAAGRQAGRAVETGGRVVEAVAKEPARVVQDLKDVDVDVLTGVTLDLSSALDPDTWVSAEYHEHVVRARSELGKLVAESARERVRAAICGALQDALAGLRGRLPDLSEQLLRKVPADAPFHRELRETLKERAVSPMWAAQFRGDGGVALASRFCLDDLLEGLVGRVLLREQLCRDILDVAAAQGLMSGSLFDLLPDLRGLLLRAVEDECAGLRRPLQESLDAFSSQHCWEARIPERDRVVLSSNFSLQELIDRTCAGLTEADVEAMRPWLRKQGGALTDIMPASGVLLLARPALSALLPAFLGRQQAFFEWSHDVVGPMTVSIEYPKDVTAGLSISVGFDFKRVVAQITARLFDGLPRTLGFNAGVMGPVEAQLDYPSAGDAGFSAQVLLKGQHLPGIIEGVVEQNRDQISAAIPVRVSRFATSTVERNSGGARWTCVNRIRLTLSVM